MRSMRGADLSMIFQEPMTSLNPVFTVGSQITEAIVLHQSCDLAQANAAAIRILDQVRIPDAAAMMKRYPHELSGGMRQRVGLARALTVNAKVLLMDEPFSAVDEQTRRKFQEELLELVANERKTFIFVTHSIEEAVYVSDRIVLLHRRPSRVHAIIEPNLSRNVDPEQIRRQPGYLDAVENIWQSLKQYLD